MATVYPFRALRPRADVVAKLASVPYDVVNREEARALAKGNPLSFLHVTKPEIDLANEIDPYDDAVYVQGKKAFETMIAEGVLTQEARPCFYAYALTMNGHTQTGVVLGASVDEYDRNIVRKHEYTRPDKENDRLRHIETIGAQTGTVFLVHKRSTAVAGVLAKITALAPACDFVAADGIRHRLWVIGDETDIRTVAEGFAALGPIYIADGHHRSAAASRVAHARRKGSIDPKATAEMFLAVSFPEDEVRIMPYNRVVRDLGGRSVAAFMGEVRKIFDVADGKPQATAPHQIGMYLDGAWYTLRVRDGSFDSRDPVARLDVSILQTLLLAPVLGVQDPRREKRIDFVGGIRGEAELERRVQAGWAVAFSLHPTGIGDLFAIADAEQVMPPKSTWFEPKLRDGLVVHRY